MNNKQVVSDIIAMLDSSISEGVSHINVTVNEEGTVNLEKTTKKTSSGDCEEGDLACKIPNLLEGVEDGNY